MIRGERELDDVNDVIATVGGAAAAGMKVKSGPIGTATATATLLRPRWPRDRGRAWSPRPSLHLFILRAKTDVATMVTLSETAAQAPPRPSCKSTPMSRAILTRADASMAW